MTLNITDEIVAKMAALAVRASAPVGLGFLHFQSPDSNVPFTDFLPEVKTGRVYIDYYNGRMVKFSGHRTSEGKWEFHDRVNNEYQSWCETYADYAVLATVAEFEYK